MASNYLTYSQTIYCDRALFWHTDDNLLNVDEVVEHASQLLKRAASAGVPPQDYSLMKDALGHV